MQLQAQLLNIALFLNLTYLINKKRLIKLVTWITNFCEKAGGLVEAFVEESHSFAIAGSALFVANKWDQVLESNQVQNVREVLLQQLAKLWPGFQEHQLVTVSSKLSALYLAVGVVHPNIEELCKGIADILANGVENIIMETAKYMNCYCIMILSYSIIFICLLGHVLIFCY